MSFSSITSYQSSIFIDIKGHCQEIQDIFLVGPRKAFDYKIRLTRTPLFHIFLYFILRWKISLKTAINEGVLEHWLAQRDRSLLFLYCMLVIALTYTHQPTPIFQIRKSSCCKTFSVTIPRSHKRNKNKPFDLFFVLCNFYYFTSHFNIPNPPPPRDQFRSSGKGVSAAVWALSVGRGGEKKLWCLMWLEKTLASPNCNNRQSRYTVCRNNLDGKNWISFKGIKTRCCIFNRISIW